MKPELVALQKVKTDAGVDADKAALIVKGTTYYYPLPLPLPPTLALTLTLALALALALTRYALYWSL